MDELSLAIQNDDYLKVREIIKSGKKEEWAKNGMSIYLACDIGSEKSAIELIRLGENFRFTLRDDDNFTIFALACSRGLEKVVKEILRLDKGYLNFKTSNGVTPFMWAALYDRLNVMKILHEKGANIHAVSNYEENILHFIVRRGNYETVNYLLSIGADPNYRGINELTPVEASIRCNNIEALKAYLNHYDKLSDENKELMKKERLRLLFV